MNDIYDQDNAPPPPPGDPPPGDGGGIAAPPISGGIGGRSAYPDDDWSFRCTVCNIDWPARDPRLFGLGPDHVWTRHAKVACPLCEEEIRLFSNLFPISLEEAWSLVYHAQFRAYFIRTRGWDPEEAD